MCVATQPEGEGVLSDLSSDPLPSPGKIIIDSSLQCTMYVTILPPYQLQLIQDELKVKANQLTSRQLPEQVLVDLTKIPVHTIDEFQVSQILHTST